MTNDRINISSGAVWEDVVGYSRVVIVGNFIEVSGTTAMDGDKLIGENNEYEQTKFIISKIEKYLLKVNATLADVVRTRIYVTNILQWEQVGKAHGEFFANIKPTTSMVQVSALINPKLLVEIEATAIIK